MLQGFLSRRSAALSDHPVEDQSDPVFFFDTVFFGDVS